MHMSDQTAQCGAAIRVSVKDDMAPEVRSFKLFVK